MPVEYKRGLVEAWEAARLICCEYPEQDMIELFGYEVDGELFENVAPEKAIKKLRDYAARQEEDKKALYSLLDKVGAVRVLGWIKDYETDS